MRFTKFLKVFSIFLLLVFITNSYSQDIGVTAVQDIKNILPLQKQLKIMEQWLEWRLDNIIPDLMRREGIDMWLIISSGEYNRDPVGITLFGLNGISFGGTGTVLFHNRGEELGIERFSSRGGKLYKPMPRDRSRDQFESLAEFIKERNPKKIGINMATHRYWSFADGLTASSKEKLEKALGPEFSSRLVSAEHLCIGWLETRSPQELSIYRHICGVAHDIIAEFYSNRVIIPDVTTLEDVSIWLRQKYISLGVDAWFGGGITIQRYEDGVVKNISRRRSGSDNKTKIDTVIRRGDLLHCDIGIVYLGLCTDTQENAYVCKIGEDEAPEGLKEALRTGNRLQDIFMNEFKTGRTGNDIFLAAINKAKEEISKPSIYTHPLGYHGHAAGTFIGLISKQEPIPIVGDYPLYLNTCHSIELNVKCSISEWGNQEVRMALEEDAAFTKEGCKFIDGRQTKLYLIK